MSQGIPLSDEDRLPWLERLMMLHTVFIKRMKQDLLSVHHKKTVS